MTVVAVLAEPPREGHVLTRLAETSPLSAAEAADCYEAVLRDTMLAVHRSGGDLLVNHPTADQLSEGAGDASGGDDTASDGADLAPEAELRAIAADTLASLDDVRFEPQVGSTFAARAGNTVTHLLREEGARSVAVVRPTAPLLTRQIVDAAAMKLRTAETVLGPSTGGRCYYAGFTDPIDFADAFATPAVTTLAERSADAGNETEFLEATPTLATGEDLVDAVATLRARFAAERVVPKHVAGFVHDLGLDVVDGDDGDPTLIRD
ncbi:DUF2064 domain-containing protein [Haloparvum alkalitolerans]|uniref:DUF2064 domain-containing protein n=1 Tax=Haloparvum alkalitolerans TaxID=1042953 RepID=UPI003CEA1DA6